MLCLLRIFRNLEKIFFSRGESQRHLFMLSMSVYLQFHFSIYKDCLRLLFLSIFFFPLCCVKKVTFWISYNVKIEKKDRKIQYIAFTKGFVLRKIPPGVKPKKKIRFIVFCVTVYHPDVHTILQLPLNRCKQTIFLFLYRKILIKNVKTAKKS